MIICDDISTISQPTEYRHSNVFEVNDLEQGFVHRFS